LPLAAWTAIIRGCKEQIRDPIFSPSFIAAVIVTDFITDVVVLRPAISAGLQVALGLATVNLLFVFWRAMTSDPGRFPVLPELNDTWRGSQECEVNVPLAKTLQSEHWDVNSFPAESSEFRDLEVGKIEPYEVSEKFERDTEEDVAVGDAGEEQSPKRLPTRARYCRKCNAWIDHFDHHCPAINNCVGRKNHVLFLGMLLAFIVAESLYIECCHLYLRSQRLLSPPWHGYSSLPIGLQGLEEAWNVICQVMNRQPWVASTACFAILQASWQIPLLLFHLYCAAVNLNTNEWLKWENYPNLYIDLPPGPGRAYSKKKFVNPYDQGVLMNLRQFFRSRV